MVQPLTFAKPVSIKQSHVSALHRVLTPKLWEACVRSSPTSAGKSIRWIALIALDYVKVVCIKMWLLHGDGWEHLN